MHSRPFSLSQRGLAMFVRQPDQLRAEDLGRFTDVLRLPSGKSLTVRFVTPDDAEALQSYFRSLSQNSRYRRLMGAANELALSELDKSTHVGAQNIFAIVAEINVVPVMLFVNIVFKYRIFSSV